MIRIWRTAKLAELLGLSPSDLGEAVERFEECCVVYRLVTPQKERQVLATHGVLRKVQDRLYKRVLARYLTPSPFSHGGVRGRSIKTNAEAHTKSRFVFKADVSSFYPSISHNRVFRFYRSLGWPEEVSRVCTRLSTYQYHLALGLVTSPILADQVFKPIDARIAGACESAGIVYTRFVDDITLSASFELDPDKCGVPALIYRILAEHGFAPEHEKETHGRVDERALAITGVRIRRARLSATPAFYSRVEAHLAAAEAMEKHRDSEQEFYPSEHVLGQIRFVRWISRGRAAPLLRRFRRIDWKAATDHALGRGLLIESPKLVRL